MNDDPALVAGRFRLGDLLGTGGSAAVYAAHDTASDRAIALKVLHPHLAGRAEASEAFLAEARRAEPLRHPRVVGVLGVGIDEQTDQPVVWIALERAAGVSLAEHIERYGPMTDVDAAIVIGGALEALEAAHGIGLTHRDVSPSNIMVALDSRGAVDAASVRLLDFGLADAAGRAMLGSDLLLNAEATGRAGVMGNVDYMSPEQARGESVDERGDLYQAGAVLYFALTGRPPFVRRTSGQTVRAHLEAPPPVPSVIAPRVPRGLDRVVVRAMLKNPDDRFATASEMRAAVSEHVAARSDVGHAFAVGRMPRTSDAGVPDPSVARTSVTRVLGSTTAPPRIPAARPPGGVPVRDVAARRRTGMGAWILGCVAALALGSAIVFAAVAPVAPDDSPAPTAPAPPPEPVADAASETPTPPAASVRVPPLGMLTRDEAIRALQAASLVVGDIRVTNSPLPADTVLESDPGADVWLLAGATVSLVVASGYNAIPEVAGLDRDAAAALMQAAGFAPSFTPTMTPADVPGGSAVRTEPGAGSIVAIGTSITVYEAAAVAPPPMPTPTPTPTPTATPTPPSVPPTTP